MTLVLCILLALGVWALAIQVLAQLAVFCLIGKRRTETLPHHWGVTVLKPLKGVDPELERNLESIFVQDWPHLELVFGSADPGDPALEVVRRVAARHPQVATRIVTSALSLGLNPKVNLCAQLARHASHDLVVISDASVVAPNDYVRSMVECFSQPNTGLVSSPLVGMGETNAGAAVDNLILNLFILRAICFTKLFARHSCVIGKSMMFRLSDLKRLGGWSEVSDVLAEDYVLGRLFRRAGFDVRLCSRLLTTRTHCKGWQDSVERHVRWCQMRRRTSATAYLAELGSNVSVWATLLVVASVAAYSAPFLLGGLLLLLAKLALDLSLMLWLNPRRLSARLLQWALLADFLNLWIWLQGAVKRTIDWRGTRLTIGAQTKLRPLTPVPLSETRQAYSTANS